MAAGAEADEGHASRRYPCDTIAYNAAISACEKGGQWQWALQLMEDIQAKGIPANTITYDTAIRAYQKGRQWQWALRPMEDMQAEGIPRDTVTI